MAEVSYILALFLFFPDTFFFNRSLLPTLDTLTFSDIAPEVIMFSTLPDFLQLLELFMQFIVYPIDHDLVVSAILAILLADEAQTRDPVLLGVLPTGENMLLFIFCQLPRSLGKVNLFSSVPYVSNIGSLPWMAK